MKELARFTQSLLFVKRALCGMAYHYRLRFM